MPNEQWSLSSGILARGGSFQENSLELSSPHTLLLLATLATLASRRGDVGKASFLFIVLTPSFLQHHLCKAVMDSMRSWES